MVLTKEDIINNNQVYIEDGIYNNLFLHIDGGNNNIIKILSTNGLNDVKILVKNSFNSVYIGKNVSMNGSLIVSCGRDNLIKIDDDCLISTNVEFWGCDGHSILQNNKIINQSKSIYIGEHTWIGANSKILKGTYIPSQCVIGANSLLMSSCTFKNNSLIAGNPAKLIKRNIARTVDNLECI